ncbi:hypothetical protein Tco_1353383 [Tanacetum coccineum]
MMITSRSLLRRSTSQESSSNVRQSTLHLNHLVDWTKDHPITKELQTSNDQTIMDRCNVKMDEFGGLLKNKARLVAQGFREEDGINFEELFASVARHRGHSILRSTSVQQEYDNFQRDVKRLS